MPQETKTLSSRCCGNRRVSLRFSRRRFITLVSEDPAVGKKRKRKGRKTLVSEDPEVSKKGRSNGRKTLVALEESREARKATGCGNPDKWLREENIHSLLTV